MTAGGCNLTMVYCVVFVKIVTLIFFNFGEQNQPCNFYVVIYPVDLWNVLGQSVHSGNNCNICGKTFKC